MRTTAPNRELPEALQGPSLAESLRKTMRYLENTPQGLPQIWAATLRTRLQPVLRLLEFTAAEIDVADDQRDQLAEENRELMRGLR